MLRSFAVRGVVEGFYGTPWSHAARLDAISFLGARGMNAYAYAPKDDARHRAEWRVPYAAVEVEQFRELAAHGATHGVQFGFAISPGLDIDYESKSDRVALMAKLQPLRDSGVSWFLLLLDDIAMAPGIAPRQAALVSWLYSALDGAALTMCPTEYVGTHPSPYLSDLGAGMPTEVDVMWTGPTVCSPTMHADDARGWTEALGDRRVIVWDNYPVNDSVMTASLHLGPYRGRDADLADVVGGVLCNPMTQAYASQVALATAMDFLSAPDTYEAAASWSRALNDVGAGRAAPLRVLAEACADSAIATPDTLELTQRVAELERLLDGADAADWIAPVASLRAELDAARALPDAFPEVAVPGDELGAEVAPWAAAARIAGDAGITALRLLQSVRPVATVDSDGLGRVVAPDPEPAMHAAFAVLYVWKGARTDERVVFGPRFALYTPVVQLPDGSPALDAGGAVREDANAIDGLCRLALRTYDQWRTTAAGAPLQVLVDGEYRPVAVDGTFDARGRTVTQTITISQGPVSTRFAVGVSFPFSDRRLR